MKSIRIQSILYYANPESVERALNSIKQAIAIAQKYGLAQKVTVAYGDCSSTPIFSDEKITMLRSASSNILDLQYKHFGENLGSAEGHNALAAELNADFVLIANPDVVFAPNTLIEMLRPFSNSSTGMVEARQLPIEHPKVYDSVTGETCWATTACALIDSRIMKALNGFDSQSFFLYCDDVDFSWRVRLAGSKVIYQPSAVVFHDKRLSQEGAWMPSSAEKYYSAEAALFMSYKWSRPDITENILREFKASSIDYLIRAAATFEKRRSLNQLPVQLDPSHQIGQFKNNMYADHRFAI